MKEKKVLIAEDNFDNYLLLKVILSSKPYNLTHVYNGKEALIEIDKNNFDILLIDIQMPEMNGFELLKILRERGDNTPAMAQTAFAFDTDKNKCYKVGFNDYISKPINQELLLSKIENLLK